MQTSTPRRASRVRARAPALLTSVKIGPTAMPRSEAARQKDAAGLQAGQRQGGDILVALDNFMRHAREGALHGFGVEDQGHGSLSGLAGPV